MELGDVSGVGGLLVEVDFEIVSRDVDVFFVETWTKFPIFCVEERMGIDDEVPAISPNATAPDVLI